MKFMTGLIAFLLCLLLSPQTLAAVNSSNVLVLNTATTNLTTAAYVTISSSLPTTPSYVIIANATTSVIKIAYGASGSETDFVAVGASATTMITLNRHFLQGVRLSLEAVSATASSGYVTVSLIQ